MKYHYTSVLHLPYILMSEKLLRSRQNAHGNHTSGLLWFSSNKSMERSALKGDIPMVRFASNNQGLIRWRNAAKEVGFSNAVMRRLEASGRKMRAVPSEWWAIVGDLTLEEVDRIELLGAHGWVGLDRAALCVEKAEGGSVRLSGPGGLAAFVVRKQNTEGCSAYATNNASLNSENLLPCDDYVRGYG